MMPQAPSGAEYLDSLLTSALLGGNVTIEMLAPYTSVAERDPIRKAAFFAVIEEIEDRGTVDMSRVFSRVRSSSNGECPAAIDFLTGLVQNVSAIAPIYTSGDLPTATGAAWKAIERANTPEILFLHGGVPARIGSDENGRPVFEVLTVDRMRHEVARAAPWKTKRPGKNKGEVIEREVPPPIDVVKDMLATPAAGIPLPVVSGITEVPTFSADGTLCDRPGYNPENRSYYAPPPGLIIPPVPQYPSDEEIRQARELLHEPVREIPFAEEADLAHHFALAIIPYVRHMVGYLVPAHIYDAPQIGTGKTIAAECALAPAYGNAPRGVQAGDEELRKRLTSDAIAGRSLIFIDNLTRPLRSAVIAAAITSETWSDRVLGKNQGVCVRNTFTFVFSGNNVALSGELARRSIRIRINAKMDRPWLREGFAIPNLNLWVMENRGRLVAAALTLVRAWIADEMPVWDGPSYGMFPQWSRIVGGILDVAGVGGFLGNLGSFYDAVDTEGNAWRQFVALWWETHQGGQVGIEQLYPIAQKVDGFTFGTATSEKGERTSLGMQLRSQNEVVYGDFQIVPSKRITNVSQWSLKRIRGGAE